MFQRFDVLYLQTITPSLMLTLVIYNIKCCGSLLFNILQFLARKYCMHIDIVVLYQELCRYKFFLDLQWIGVRPYSTMPLESPYVLLHPS